ncbi:DUF4183 domain-containing protein [Bacillus sp. CGMCC 1.16541]|uniref:DUF4183 domain-containing protein n=1 Tax=Bacillus sp. CGMCC 1.16541 TaxID=2185143 RepID=UPI000D73D060|nr:DUF4183 domain-containing protein [Bacillus sp. CGMCC 1.16541]
MHVSKQERGGQTKPVLTLPTFQSSEKMFKRINKADVDQYCTKSDGHKKVYTNKDSLKKHSTTRILDPCTVSYVNLFINGVLQPPHLYVVKKGELVLLSVDVPLKGVPIILQFVRVYS